MLLGGRVRFGSIDIDERPLPGMEPGSHSGRHGSKAVVTSVSATGHLQSDLLVEALGKELVQRGIHIDGFMRSVS